MCGPSELTQGLRPWNNHFQSSIVFFCFFLSEALRNINSTSFVSSSKRQIFRLLQFRKAWRVVLLIHLTGYDCTSVTGLLTVKPVICRVVCSFVFIWESSGREFFLRLSVCSLSPHLSRFLSVWLRAAFERPLDGTHHPVVPQVLMSTLNSQRNPNERFPTVLFLTLPWICTQKSQLGPTLFTFKHQLKLRGLACFYLSYTPFKMDGQAWQMANTGNMLNNHPFFVFTMVQCNNRTGNIRRLVIIT